MRNLDSLKLTGILMLFGLLLNTVGEVTAQTYCSSGASSTYDSEVDFVGLTGNVNSISNNTASICAKYTDFTGLTPADLSPGDSYTITITTSTCGGNYPKGAKVFIDWNQDYDFTDADEAIGYTTASGSNTTYTIPLTVPLTSSLGSTRMRVIVKETSTPSSITPCGIYSYGETEDYTVSIMSANNDDIAVIGVSPTTICSGTTNFYAVVKNMGGNTVNNFLLDWTLDGVAQTQISYTSPISIGGTANILLGNINFENNTYNIVITASLPNGAFDPSPANNTLSLLPFYLSLNGTYSIGATGDFVDFATAVNALSVNGICGPVVFAVETGTYTEQITIPEITGASATNTITFQSASGINTEVVVQYASAGNSNNWVWAFYGADYVLVQNITIKSTTPHSFGGVVEFRGGSDYNELSNCIIQSISPNSMNATSIRSYTDESNNYNTIIGNTITGGYYGITWYSSSSSFSQGNDFEDNEIQDFSGYGAFFYYQNSIQFNGNIVDNGLALGNEGIKFNSCGNIQAVGNKVNIHGSNTQQGISINNCNATSVNPGLIANNFISLSGTGTSSWYGMAVGSSTYFNVYFNSLNLTGGSTFSSAVYQSAGSNQKYNNNIFMNSGGGYSAYIGTPTAIVSSDYNNFYTTGTNLAYWQGNKTNLAALQTANGKDANSVSDNPGFGSITDLHAHSISLNGAGTPIAGITTDIDDDARDASNPDIGADEFTPPQHDAGVIAFDEPLNPASPGNISVKVSIRNFGTDPLTSTTIILQIDGVTVGSYPWTGSLASGATESNISLGTHNFTVGITQLKAWTEDSNGQIDGYALNDVTEVEINICNILTGTYTIGGSSPDFTDFASALFPLHHCGISGPVVFNIASGTYTEQITIGQIQGVSSINTITFQSASGDNTDVVIDYSANSSADNWVVKLDGADYISIKNLTIKATGATYAYAVHLTNGAEHNVFEGNIIQSIQSTNDYAHAVFLSSQGLNQYNTFENNVIEGGKNGIACSGAAQGNVFVGNEIIDFSEFGAAFSGQNSIQFDNNIVDNLVGAYSVNGTYFNNCDNFHAVGNKVNIHGSNTQQGMYISGCDATVANANLIANNFISITGTGTYICNGIIISASSHLNFYYNSVNIITSSTSSRAVFQIGVGYNQNYKNNIFINSGGGYSTFIYEPSAIASSDYNDYYTTGTNFVYWGYMNMTNLADLQAASGKDVNSVSVDPGFASPTDLHAHSIVINEAGSPITGITTDIDEDARDATTPDIGADEFIPPPNDAGVIAIDEPLNPSSPGNISVKVSIKNFGTDLLISTTIKLQINGIIVGSYPWTGSLTSGATENNISLETHNFTLGLTQLKAWTEIPNGQTDGYALNDATEAEINICNLLSGTYTIGVSSLDFTDFASAVSQLQDCGIAGPVVFNVESGTYPEQIAIGQVSGVSTINTITFQSSSGDNTDVVIQYSASSQADNWVVKLDGAEYISFKNLTIKAAGTNYAYAVHLTNGAEHNVFENNLIQCNQLTSSYSRAVVLDSGALNQYNTFENNAIGGGNYGIYCNGASSSSLAQGNVFIGNEIDFYKYGVFFQYQNSIQFDNNIVDNQIGGSYVTGSYFSNCDNIHVVGNKVNIHGTNYKKGMYIYSCDATAVNPGLIANNFISLTGTGTSDWDGMHVFASFYLNVYYNSINITGGPTSSSALRQESGGNLSLKNNIFMNSSGGFSTVIYYPDGIVSSDYNDYYTTGTNLAYWSGNITNLADLQIVSGKDDHSLSVDPTFISAIDLHTSNVYLEDAGTPIVGITDDIDGETRSLTTPDIGADEYGTNLLITVLTKDADVYLDENGQALLIPEDVDNGTSGNCSYTLTVLPNSFTCNDIGLTTVTLTASASGGYSVSETATVSVLDAKPPTILTQNATINLDASGQASITTSMIDNSSFDNCGIDTYALDFLDFTCADVGTNIVTLTVTDVNGNVNSAIATVTVVDAILPTVTTQNATIYLDAAGQASITESMIHNTSSDNCGIASIDLDILDFTCADVGAKTVSLTATDVNGNIISATATTTVVDAIFPTVITQNVTIYLDALGQASITVPMIDNGSFDNCGIASYALDIMNFTCADVGAHSVTLTATDASGNSSSATAVVTVVDTESPVISGCPAPIDAEVEPGQWGAHVSWVEPTATDNCALSSFTSNHQPGELFNVGSTIVTYNATDEEGNESTCQFYVTVTPPNLVGKVNVAILSSDISFSDNNPDLSSTVSVSAVIRNNSSINAGSFVVQMKDVFSNTIYPPQTILGLNAGHSTVVNNLVTTPGIAAFVPVKVTIDLLDVLDESSELDNRAIRPFICGNLATLGTVGLTTNAVPSTIPAGSVIQICGSAFYENVSIPNFDPSVAGAEVVITITETGQQINGYTNENGDFCYSYTTPNTPGLYNYTVEITDNTLGGNQSGTFTLSPPVYICPTDLSVSIDLTGISPNGQGNYIIPVGTSFSGTVYVHNNCQAISQTTSLFIGLSSGTSPGEFSIPALSSGETYSIPLPSITLSVPGSCYISSTIDYYDIIVESNELNNTAYKTLIVIPLLPDIAVFGGNVLYGLQCQSNNEVNFTIKNIGLASTGNFNCDYNIYVNGIQSPSISQTIQNLDPNEDQILSFPFTTPTSTDVYKFELIADIPDLVTELSELNNHTDISLVFQPCQADIVVLGCEYTNVTPADPQSPGNITVSAIIMNAGQLPVTTPFTVDFDVAGTVISETVTVTLTSGQSLPLSVVTPVPIIPFGTLTVTADVDNDVPEEFENNNAYSASLCYEFELEQLDCGGDPIFKGTQHFCSPADLQIGYWNLGIYEASNFQVKFEISGPGLTGWVNLGTASQYAGNSCGCPSSIGLPNTFYYPHPGIYQVRMTADPNNLYPELDETNNIIILTVNVVESSDYKILSSFISPSNINPDINEEISFNVSYTNIGCAGFSQIELYTQVDNTVLYSTDVPGLPAGGMNSVSIPNLWSSAVPGIHVFRAIIDNTELINEVDEMNNEATKAFLVGDAPDYHVLSVSSSDMTPDMGQQLTFTASVLNEGQTMGSGLLKFIYVNGQGAESTLSEQTISIVPGIINSVDIVSTPWTTSDIHAQIIARVINVTPIEFDFSDNEQQIQLNNMSVTLSSTDVICFGESNGEITVDVTGGVPPINYEWDNPAYSGQIINVPAGQYTVTVKDFLGLTVTESITTTEPDELIADASFTPILCNGGSSTVTISATCGTPSYSGTGTYSVNAGTYTYNVIDGNGCSDDVTITVTEPNLLTLTETHVDASSNFASDGSIDLTVEGGTAPYLYVWINGQSAEDLSSLPAGTYSVTVSDNNNCMAETSVTISNLTIGDNVPPTVITQDVTIYLDALGQASITISMIDNGSFDNFGIASMSLDITEFTCLDIGPNTVTLTVTDVNSNSNSGTAVATVVDNMDPIVSCPADQIRCKDAALQAGINNYTATNGEFDPVSFSDNCGTVAISFVLSGATTATGSGTLDGQAFNEGETAVSWTVSDASGNSSACSFTVTIHPLPVVTITTSSADDFCNGVTLTANSTTLGNQYLWSNNETTQAIFLSSATDYPGNYSVTVTDLNGCVSNAVAQYIFAPEELISSYTILAFEDLKLDKRNYVQSGSVGLTGIGEEIIIKQYSEVNGPGSFVKGDNIDIYSNAVVTTAIFDPAESTLPTMYYNSEPVINGTVTVSQYSNTTVSDNNVNIKIKKNSVVTINGNAFGKIEIDRGCTVTFTSPEIEIEEISTNNSTNCDPIAIIFTQDTKVKVLDEAKFHQYNIINPDQYNVVFYLGEDPNPTVIPPGNSPVVVTNYIYGFRGDSNKDFWRYDLSSDSWTDMEDAPGYVGGGGSMVYAGLNDIFAFRGNDKKDFWRYDTSTDTWTDMEDAPENIENGGALVYAGGNYIYGLRGGCEKDFWRYDISLDAWMGMEDTPENVKYGGALVYAGGNYLYAFRGNDKVDFWRYDISTDSWSAMDDAPENVKDGGALLYAGNNYIYAYRGDDEKDFWSYNILLDTWSVLEDAPENVKSGASLVNVDGVSIFALRGNNDEDFWKYNISTDSWSVMEDAPENVNAGGALTYAPGNVIISSSGSSSGNSTGSSSGNSCGNSSGNSSGSSSSGSSCGNSSGNSSSSSSYNSNNSISSSCGNGNGSLKKGKLIVFSKGTTFNVSAYVPAGEIEVKSNASCSDPGYMNGFFIANEVNAGAEYTYWNWRNCGPTLSLSSALLPSSIDIEGFEGQDIKLKTYPNPFSDKVVIEFELAKTNKALVEIFNVSSQRINVIFNEEATENQVYSVILDGSQFQAGMYQVKVTVEALYVIKKIILIK
ncbi:MAG: HYR domain-containing protein [Bacteroidales bacterium]|nr:HYR domain-containing protein [Bacteroidales bacterium]MCF8455510.1 HYR domain-containing protein [Bacteroidales bacterium]